jgi:FK506-binding protein 6
LLSSQLGHLVLKDGIDLDQVMTGTTFEVDLDRSSGPLTPSDKFKGEELYNQISHLSWADTSSTSESDNEELSPFEIQARRMSNITEDGGVKKKVLREGAGSVVPEGALVRVHYNGYLEYADEPYDSTRLRHRQWQFKLGESAIPGLSVAIATMRRGELSRFLISPQYAFGERGCPPRVPPNSTILYEIELMSFVDYKSADEYASFPEEEKKTATFDQLLEVAAAEKSLGNDLFEQRVYSKAVFRYNKALGLIEDVRLKDEREEKLWKSALLKLYLNLSLCHLKQKKTQKAARFCHKALDLDENSVKAHFRLGQAFMLQSEFEKSKKHLLKAAKLSPGNLEIREEIQKLERTVQKFKSIEREVSMRMFADVRSKQGAVCEDSDNMAAIQEQLEELKVSETQTQIVFPNTLDDKDLAVAKHLAEGMDLGWEELPKGLKVFQKFADADHDGQ